MLLTRLLKFVLIFSHSQFLVRSRGRRRRSKQAMAGMGSGPDHLFNLRNTFYLGAYQTAINNSEIPNLSPEDAVERDCLVFRSYIALGSYQVSLYSSR